ncbi:MAG: 3'(2'),5'-bisphosphate nucleotidase, partial [Acidobacteriota bacterium]
MHFLNQQTDDIRFAVELVRECSKMARDIQREMVTPALQKDDRSPVTVADFAVQAVIGKRLAERFSRTPLVAEESTKAVSRVDSDRVFGQIADFVRPLEPSADSERVRKWIDRGQVEFSDRFWVLDPIDGTKGFLRGDQ